MQQQRFQLPLTSPRLWLKWARRGGRHTSWNRAANCRLQRLANSRTIAVSVRLPNRNLFAQALPEVLLNLSNTPPCPSVWGYRPASRPESYKPLKNADLNTLGLYNLQVAAAGLKTAATPEFPVEVCTHDC